MDSKTKKLIEKRLLEWQKRLDEFITEANGQIVAAETVIAELQGLLNGFPKEKENSE